MDTIQTSQQKRGEHHLAEGKGGAGAPDVQYGQDGSPTGLSTEKNIKNPLKTAQQIQGDYSLNEGE